MVMKENLWAKVEEFRYIYCCPDKDWIGFMHPNLMKKDS